MSNSVSSKLNDNVPNIIDRVGKTEKFSLRAVMNSLSYFLCRTFFRGKIFDECFLREKGKFSL